MKKKKKRKFRTKQLRTRWKKGDPLILRKLSEATNKRTHANDNKCSIQ